MSKYSIRIAGLKEGEHKEIFKLKSGFFDRFEHSEVKRGNFIVKTKLLLRGVERYLTINIEGYIRNLLCDICAQELEIKISTTMNFLIKQSIKEFESTDEIIYVLQNQHQLSLSQLIYEMINLTIPKKRIHKTDARGSVKCDNEMLVLLDKYATNKKTVTDPRLEVLKEIKL